MATQNKKRSLDGDNSIKPVIKRRTNCTKPPSFMPIPFDTAFGAKLTSNTSQSGNNLLIISPPPTKRPYITKKMKEEALKNQLSGPGVGSEIDLLSGDTSKLGLKEDSVENQRLKRLELMERAQLLIRAEKGIQLKTQE